MKERIKKEIIEELSAQIDTLKLWMEDTFVLDTVSDQRVTAYCAHLKQSLQEIVKSSQLSHIFYTEL